MTNDARTGGLLCSGLWSRNFSIRVKIGEFLVKVAQEPVTVQPVASAPKAETALQTDALKTLRDWLVPSYATFDWLRPPFSQDQFENYPELGPDKSAYQWSRGLSECFNEISICCGVFWCPCCAMSIVASYVGKDCPFAWGFCGCCCWPLLRHSLREKHKIYGIIGDDWLIGYSLTLCMMCQMFGELEYGRYKVTGFS